MRVMVLGSGGFVGSAVARACVQLEHEPVCVSRITSDTEFISVEGNRNQPHDIADLLETYACEAVVDMIGYTAATTEALLRAIAGWSGRYVLISSADVYRNYGLLHRLEEGQPDPGLLDETALLRSHLYPYKLAAPRADTDPQKWMDDYDKILVERVVQEMRPDWTICRLPMVYGPGDPQMRFAWAYAPMMAGTDRIELPGSWLDWTLTHGHV
ncbi:MAG: NAD-dependent epimerase/dehydratase family protein, partial [Pseudomonadota bacterium]